MDKDGTDKMKWSKENLYKRWESYSKKERQGILNQAMKSPYRQQYHIQPPGGLLNDPNGLAYFNGRFHVFYQWFPMGAVHGLKYWYHVTSANLVDWVNEGAGLEPDTEFDSHGVYSGSALPWKGELLLVYTGNTRTESWERVPYQMLARMDSDGKIQKAPNPMLSGTIPGYTDHLRDPKLWQEQDMFYCVLGAQRENETGTCLLLSSKDMQSWENGKEIQTGLTDFGYMWECPDYFELEGRGILLFSPQGLSPEGDCYQNIYQTGYLVGAPLNLANGDFKEHGSFKEIDLGFDFYATQTFLARDGRRLLFAWMGLPEIDYPTDKENWAHCLTIPRELYLQNDQIIQVPARELEQLRQTDAPQERKGKVEGLLLFPELAGISYELEVEMTAEGGAEEFGLLLRASKDGKRATRIALNCKKQKIMLDRTVSGQPFAENYGTVRQTDYKERKINLRIFADSSSVECFISDGTYTFTSRIFPYEDQDQWGVFSEGGESTYCVRHWKLRRSVE